MPRRCRICRKAPAMKHADVCGCCELIEAADKGESVAAGVVTDKLVPAHFNRGLGEHIENYGHLKKRLKAAEKRGIVPEQ